MSAPKHVPMSDWTVLDDCLVVGNLPLTQLAERVGRTPFYAYDRRRLDDRVALLRRHLPPVVRLHYAIKANPMPALVCHMAHIVDGLDVASAGELKIALDSGMQSENISFAGPGKSEGELKQAVAAGVLVNVESPRELAPLVRSSQALGCKARVAVRVNPDFELKSSGMKMGGGAKQFGVDAEEVPALVQEIGRSGLDFEGLHIFSGSQNLRVRTRSARCSRGRSSLRSPSGLPRPLRSGRSISAAGLGFRISRATSG
jgi:diaminopimelate decarboxylase